jgi:hypothetical protein
MTDPTVYGPAVTALLTPPRVAELGPGTPNRAVRDALARFDPLADLGKPVRDPAMARACLSGLWLYHDFLDESHAISQGLETPEGCFWHAILHRREPDAGNSKYWWRQVGAHPVLDGLAVEIPEYPSGAGFVDLCERVRGSGSPREARAREVQHLEWHRLFDWCYRHAGG